MLAQKALSAPATAEQVLQINSLQFLKLSQIPAIYIFSIRDTGNNNNNNNNNNNRISKEEESVDILKIPGLINMSD